MHTEVVRCALARIDDRIVERDYGGGLDSALKRQGSKGKRRLEPGWSRLIENSMKEIEGWN